MEWPTISVVVLNFNGKQHLEECFKSLVALDYPADKCELMLVDNASADESVAFVRAHFPTVRIVQNEDNLGFAAGNNRGAQAAHGDYVVFLNNDTRVDGQWLKELVAPCLADAEVVCTASKMLAWDGSKVDFVSSAMNFHGFAFQPDYGARDVFDQSHPLLFACGGAMLIRRNVFLDLGGFDEDYFIYFEDVDLGWRVWLSGYRVLFAPKAIVYHRLHATMDAFSQFRKWVLFERNALVTLIKNYDEANLSRALPAALMLMFKRADRMMEAGGWNAASYFIRNQTDVGLTETVSRSGLAVMVAANEVIENLPYIFAKRRRVQALRQRPDAEILPLFRHPLFVNRINFPELDEQYAVAQYQVAAATGLETIFQDLPRRVLVISSDLLPLDGLPTTGAGLRAWSIGQGLALRGHDVLYSMPRAAVQGGKYQVTGRTQELLWEVGKLDAVINFAAPDVVVACGWSTLSQLKHCAVPVVLDQHGPHLLERKFQDHLDTESNRAEKLYGLSRADFFTCAGERQRQYFLPWLRDAGWADPDASSATVPVSLGGAWPPLPEKPADREPVFVYGGVFLPWQDPSLALLTLVERMEATGRGKLRIFGGKHPFLPIDTGRFDQLLERLAQSKHVEISPMLGRDALLVEYQAADVALDLMKRNEERELAFTTRTVEYLWCGLPVVYNNYGELADYIGPADAGWCIDPEDATGMAALFDQILLHPEILRERSQNARRLADERLNWATTVEPIDRFCRMPYKRRATPAPAAQAAQPGAPVAVAMPRKGLRALFGEAAFHFRRGGIRGFIYEFLGFLQRKVQP